MAAIIRSSAPARSSPMATTTNARPKAISDCPATLIGPGNANEAAPGVRTHPATAKMMPRTRRPREIAKARIMVYHLTREVDRIGLNRRPRFTPQIMCQNKFVKSAWTPYGPKQVRNGPTPQGSWNGPVKVGPRSAPIRRGIQRAELMIQSAPPQMSPLTRFTVGVMGRRGLISTPRTGLMIRPKIKAQMIPSIMWMIPPMMNVVDETGKVRSPNARRPLRVLKSNCGSLTPGNHRPVTVATIVAINPAAAALVAAFLPIRNRTFESDPSWILSPPVGDRWLHYITFHRPAGPLFRLGSGRNLFTFGFPSSVNDRPRRTWSLHRWRVRTGPFGRDLSGVQSSQRRSIRSCGGGPRSRCRGRACCGPIRVRRALGRPNPEGTGEAPVAARAPPRGPGRGDRPLGGQEIRSPHPPTPTVALGANRGLGRVLRPHDDG